MARWDTPNLDAVDADGFAEDIITMQVNSGLFANFLGCVVGQHPPEFIINMVQHFLASLTIGTHQSLADFRIVSMLLSKGEPSCELVVAVQNIITEDWHTHIIKCTGPIVAEEGELIIISPDEDED